jgi:FixJ family two-component response regulator
VVSSITDAEIETRALKAGADAFLPKPFEVSAILDHVARLLGQSKGA